MSKIRIFNIKFLIFLIIFFVFIGPSLFFNVDYVLADACETCYKTYDNCANKPGISSECGTARDQCLASCGHPSFGTALPEAQTAAGGAGVSTQSEPEPYIAKIIGIALSLVGVIFLMLMVYGGYVWMMAKGDETEAKKAQGIITMAIIGIIVVIAAYAATKFVVDRLIGAAT